ncbi:sigma-54 dependent transcriptional regulator [Vibrio sp. B1Z05]|uniref:sigma-54-dependent transcriptional regulator n=1 Tax=Vibrio sp. B1Z05 TaxID=2654980 RepID=UPI00128DA88E|nr:sigma-54 dependent transcriptional regulator [Vibrio sp. B1Z05]MPW36449.1 response regulator [Vibrio sp. B1Z05]
MGPKVLLVEDSNSLAILYKQYVKDEAYDLFHVETGKDAKRFIQHHTPQLVILDLKLPDTTGEEILDWINEQEIATSVIIATAHGSVNTAVNLIQKGADDFLEKPITADRLKTSVALHLKRTKLESLVNKFESKFDRPNYHGFIGSSLPMQAVYKIIDAAAPTTASVFINGESGTGKEVCAEAIHKQSKRADKPFVALNCGAIPRDLMESEIFGHVKGAFTGATTDRKGAAMQAHGGTLFLDELCEMELEMQKKLLRFLQTGSVTPLGSSKELKGDVRIICATNKDPLKEIEAGRFREDLYYRVHVIPITLPPLRERDKDIATLAKHFVKLYAKQDGKKFTGLTAETEARLKNYPWPGNVRQLQNIMRNVVVLNDGTKVEVSQLPPPLNTVSVNTTAVTKAPIKPVSAVHITPESITPDPVDADRHQATAPVTQFESASPDEKTHHAPTTHAPTTHAPTTHDAQAMPNNVARAEEYVIKPMWQVERETIQNAIKHCDGNVINAAVLLDLSPSTVYRKKQQWETEDDLQTSE